MKPTLTELGRKYASDKLYWHSYLPKYEELFAGMEVKRLLEIGIGFEGLMRPFLPEGVEYVHGSSLKMWEEYFPEAEIFACDIREDTLVNEGRIRSIVCDQVDILQLGRMIREFGLEGDKLKGYEVIIDDGSHDPDHQWFTAAHLLPQLRSGGLYIIEDVWPENGQHLAKEFGGEFWQGEKGRDDGLVIIRR